VTNGGAVAAIRNMEAKLANKDSIYLKSSKIIAKRMNYPFILSVWN